MKALATALYGYLAGGTALTASLGGTLIYNMLAPQGQDQPYVVFFQSAATDQNSSPRRARDFVYTVKALGTTLSQALDLDELIDARLHGAAITISATYGNYWTMRENDVLYTEDTGGGALIWHAGAQYRIRLAQV
jgi:hypothetical protein